MSTTFSFSTSMPGGWRHSSEAHIRDPQLLLAIRRHKRKKVKAAVKQSILMLRCAAENRVMRLQAAAQKSSRPSALVADAERRAREAAQ